MTQKGETRSYFDTVAAGYLDRYYRGGAGRYPNLQLRAEIVMSTIRGALKGGARVLDAGCGGGNLVADLTSEGYEVQGIDLAPKMVEVSRARVAELPEGLRWRCHIQQGDIESLPYLDASFDGAVASGVFEYLENDYRALSELSRVLRPGGIAIISFRNRAFNVFSLNRYTLSEIEAGEFPRLLDAATRRIAEDRKQVSARIPALYEELRAWIGRLGAPRRPGDAPEAVVTAITPPAGGLDERAWEKMMARRQHTVDEVRAAGARAGLALAKVSFFHFHPLPPAFRELMPELYDVLGLVLERFSGTGVGELLASGFVGTFVAGKAVA